jgi:hypothetical protein
VADASGPRPLFGLLLLFVGTAASAYAVGHRRWEVPGVALAAAGVVAWTLTNRAYEGAVLLTPFPGNGLTAADLLCGPAAGLVGWLSWRGMRR